MSDLIPELIDACNVDVLDTETVYKPIDGVSDKWIIKQLDISQGGAHYFHKALRRPGRANVPHVV
jgi:hypothetical protein